MNGEVINYKYEEKLIGKSALRYIIPSIITLVFSQTAPLVDAACVSASLGNVALSALSNVEPVVMVTSVLGSLGGVGCGILVSKCSGSGEKEKAAKAFTITTIALTIFSILISALALLFIDPLLKFLWTTPENVAFAKEYLIVILIGFVITTITFAWMYIFVDDNNPNLVMVGTVVAAVVNVIIDLVGLNVFHFGIWVAAFGTIFGEFVSLVIFFFHFRKKDTLSRFVNPRNSGIKPGEILKPGFPLALTYILAILQMFIQNFVLSDEGGTSGLGDSAVMDNLVVFLAIFILGQCESIMPLASAYFGEKNTSCQLLAKRMLFRIGLIVIPIILILLAIFPEAFMRVFSVTDEKMLETLPFAIRIMCISQFFIFILTYMANYFASIEKEIRGDIAFGIEGVVSIIVTIALKNVAPMDAPWYGSLAGAFCACIYVLFICRGTKGLVKFHPENLLMITGGVATMDVIEDWKNKARDFLSKEQSEQIENDMIKPFISSIEKDITPLSSFTILDLGEEGKSVVLRYDESSKLRRLRKKEAHGHEEEVGEEDIDYGVVVVNEFNSLRRMMIKFRN